MLKILQENKKFQGLGWVRNRIWVLERCRRRLFFVKKRVFGPGTLPQAPFLNNFLHFPGPSPILGQLSNDIPTVPREFVGKWFSTK